MLFRCPAGGLGGHPHRAEHPPGHEPAQPARRDGHDSETGEREQQQVAQRAVTLRLQARGGAGGVGRLRLLARGQQRRRDRDQVIALQGVARRLALLEQGAQRLVADRVAGRRLRGQAAGHQPVGEPEQRQPGGEEQRGVDEREPGPDPLRPKPPPRPLPQPPPRPRPKPPPRPLPKPPRTRVHGSRYPLPTTVSIGSGSPSLRRSRPIVTVTVRVNGSAFSSQTRSSRSSVLTTLPLATRSSSRIPISLRVSESGRPARLTRRRARSNTMSPRTITGTAAGVRRASDRTLATSSSNANGLPR